ncbi:MAG TPA: site-specific DNA-methyltransferase [Marmoricola sp.]|nr:site-specific DNA-methyltransferase [Marmoricola sp.]
MVELIWTGKYDERGKVVAPVRVSLPFQTIETVNESAQQRQMAWDLLSMDRPADWRNRLIWGDKKYVLPALLDEFAEEVSLIYIDPPFFTGDDFSFNISVDGEDFTKEPSLIEQKAYRDTWGSGLDSYLAWFHSTVIQLRELLTPTGSIFVHLDWHVGHYAKLVLDEVFGTENFRNEIVWHYYNKLQGNINRFASNHDVIFWYSKSANFHFARLREQRETPKRQQKRVWDGASKSLKQARDEDGKLIYYTETERTIDDVWRLPYLMPADKTENLGYPTQKPELLLERIILASTEPGDLVLDCFAGSGTTAAVAEQQGRRWITSDLGRFAINTTRKRLLSNQSVQPFVVQNLGKYERQLWQAAEFGDSAGEITATYRNFILDLYHAEHFKASAWLHGVKQGRMVHVGTVDAPVTVSDVRQIVADFAKIAASGSNGPSKKAIDVLGWDFAFELNEVARQDAQAAGIDLRLVRIPREVLERRAVEQGDIAFFELAALDIQHVVSGLDLDLAIRNFIIPLDDVPAEVQEAVSHWSQWIDYWAVDWENHDDTFHNEWQTYRTRNSKTLDLETLHHYSEPGEYRVVIKVIDILGNDTTKVLNVKVG